MGTVNNSQTFGVRIDSVDTVQVDEISKNSGLTRSATFGKIVKEYLGLKHCLKCGALNDSEGKSCCVCNTPLYSDLEIFAAIIAAVPGANDCKILERKPWDKYLSDGLQGEVYPYIKRVFGHPDEYQLMVRFKTRSGFVVQPEEDPVVRVVDKDRVLDFVEVVRKRFEGKPTARAEFIEQYKLT